MAGGGLLDVGVYPVSLASMLFGTPTDITGVAQMGETGVDEQAAISLKYSGGQVAALTTGVRINTPHEALHPGHGRHDQTPRPLVEAGKDHGQRPAARARR